MPPYTGSPLTSLRNPFTQAYRSRNAITSLQIEEACRKHALATSPQQRNTAMEPLQQRHQHLFARCHGANSSGTGLCGALSLPISRTITCRSSGCRWYVNQYVRDRKYTAQDKKTIDFGTFSSGSVCTPHALACRDPTSSQPSTRSTFLNRALGLVFTRTQLRNTLSPPLR